MIQLPKYEIKMYSEKANRYALLIPTLNEGKRIQKQLNYLFDSGLANIIDIFILDSLSQDGSVNDDFLQKNNVKAKITIFEGKQGSAFRAGFYEALNRGYSGIVTVDGNYKDSMDSIKDFISSLDEGYDFIQGSRFISGGYHENTPIIRLLAMKIILIPFINFLSKYHYSEVASAFRGYSAKMLNSGKINIFRDCFISYEFLWYMSVQAPINSFKVTEIPTKRCYPSSGKIPTKIKLSGCFDIIRQLIFLAAGKYN